MCLLGHGIYVRCPSLTIALEAHIIHAPSTSPFYAIRLDMSPTLVASRGIYHGLPSFPEHDGKSYTALIVGATGITGAYIIRVLAQSPKRWGKIYALSRKPPSTPLPANVKHISVDLLAPVDTAVEKLKTENVVAQVSTSGSPDDSSLTR